MPLTRDLSFDTLKLEQNGRVLTVRFSHPPLNFMPFAFMRDLDRLTSSVDRDPTVGAVVLTGGIEGRCLTHLDARELGGIQNVPLPQVPMWVMQLVVPVTNWVMGFPGLARALEKVGGDFGKGIALGYRWKRSTLRMNRSGVVYIAAINGPTLDGGLEIVMACDLRYAGDAPALRISQSELLVGIAPGGGGSQRMVRMLGTARALEHMLEAVPLTAPEALALGLVHRVVPEQRLLAEAQATAARLARRAPVSVKALKRAVYFGMDRSLPRALDFELAGCTASGFTPAARRAQQPYLDDLDRLGDTPFLADPKPWIEGTRVDLIGKPTP
jgi:enoyl-CoA hydratase/carnithine racemase